MGSIFKGLLQVKASRSTLPHRREDLSACRKGEASISTRPRAAGVFPGLIRGEVFPDLIREVVAFPDPIRAVLAVVLTGEADASKQIFCSWDYSTGLLGSMEISNSQRAAPDPK